MNATSSVPRSLLTLGTANLAMAYGATNGPEARTGPQAGTILDRAWDVGIRSVDTAAAYGQSEARIGRWRQGRGQAFDVITKAPPLQKVDDDDISNVLTGSCEASLRKLGATRLKGYLLHRAEDMSRRSVADALAELKSRRLIEAIGVSIYEPDQGFKALDTGLIDMLQTPFNIFDRRFAASGLADACEASGVMVFARSVYLQGLLAVEPGAVPHRLASLRPFVANFGEIARHAGSDGAGIALRYVLDEPRIGSVIIGANTPGHIDDAIAAMHAGPLDKEIVDRIDALAATVPPALLDPRTWPR